MKNKENHFLYLLRYARPHWRLVLAQFALMALAVGLGLLKPWPIKILVDNVVGGLPLTLQGWSPEWTGNSLLLIACVAYVILHGGESLVAFGSVSVAALSSGRMIRDLRAHLLRVLQGLSLKFHDSHKVGDLVHRVTYNSSAVETAFQSGFMGAIKSAVTLVAIFFVMFAMNRPLTLVALAVVPPLLVSIRLYAKRIQRHSLQHQNQEGSVSSRLQELLSGIRLVQAFNREPWEQDRFDRLSRQSVATRLRMTMAQGGFGLCVAIILALGTALLFYVGVRQVLLNRLTIGEFLVFNAYLGMLYSPLSVLSYTASSVQSALGGGARLFEIIEAENDGASDSGKLPLPSLRGAIRFENVRFAYEEGRPVLDGVDFEIQPGETVALIGETGSGKSTILSLLLRFYRPTGGRIIVDGRDVEEYSIRSLREQLSLVPQESLLFSDSIRENIAYGRTEAGRAEIEEAARLAEAHDFILDLPEGYETLVGERGIRLSVGQRQRIALARAFLRRKAPDTAPILLLDEPSSALDAHTEAKLMRNLERLTKGGTVLLVTHRLSTVRRADRVILLEKGRIIEAGTHEELLARGGAYARLWKSQSESDAVGVRE
jgi:ATP-binding cassette subfamily B protein/subfamily B ATP-binding cassette protein MsbA